jgi:hypothetical protein
MEPTEEEKAEIVRLCIELINKGMLFEVNLMTGGEAVIRERLERTNWQLIPILTWLDEFIFLTNGRQTPTNRNS